VKELRRARPSLRTDRRRRMLPVAGVEMGRLRLTRIMLAAVVAGCQATAASTTPTVGPAEAPNPTSQPTATAALPRPKPVAQPLEIWGELPLTGRYATLSEEIETAFQLAVQADGATVRNWTIRYVSHDDGSAASGTWSADLAIASAAGAISDPAVVAYLGPYNSGAAKVAIPVLCTAGIAMVSAGTTYPGLTRPAASGEPEAYYRAAPGTSSGRSSRTTSRPTLRSPGSMITCTLAESRSSRTGRSTECSSATHSRPTLRGRGSP